VSDETKKLILARRARFIAAAMASVGVACGKTNEEPPHPCLSVEYVPDAAQPEPMPCLSVAVPVAADGAPPDVDASTDATDAGATTKAEKDAGTRADKPPVTPKTATPPPTHPPAICLSPLPPPRKTTQ
jgi:hypothetical protein